MATPASAESPQMAQDINQLSIEELSQIEITSVSKKAESINTAAASIYVITADDIRRSGATSIPEILRLAPNLEVQRVNASSYAITARGFDSGIANKLLVLIDGRNVYTPIQGGVYWDMQDVMPGDIERIEVISGPGATLWGANAINGVINIITRNANDTKGGVAEANLGTQEHGAALQYGSHLSDDLAYRIYAKGFFREPTVLATGVGAHDEWEMPQGGFRMDWTHPNDTVTVQGDFYQGEETQPNTVDQTVSGQNILARWQHQSDDGSTLQVQAYWDRTRRLDLAGFVLDTYDIDVQDSFALASWNTAVVGGGYRIEHDVVTNAPAFQFQPPVSTEDLGNVFAEDTLSLAKSLKFTLGLKLEDDPFSGLAPLPDARLSWQIDPNVVLWTAVSRAVRAPTLYDRQVQEYLGPIFFLEGGANFQAEKLWAYQLGTRVEPASNLSLSLTGYYNVYNDLRSYEPTPKTTFPLYFANLMAGHVYGLEGWATYGVTAWWRLQAGFTLQREDLRFMPGGSGLGGLEQAGNDPDHQVSLRSDVNFSKDLAWDAALRYVAALPDPAVAAYTELDSSLNWNVTNRFELALTGDNLLHRRHIEFATTSGANEISRSVLVDARLKF